MEHQVLLHPVPPGKFQCLRHSKKPLVLTTKCKHDCLHKLPIAYKIFLTQTFNYLIPKGRKDRCIFLVHFLRNLHERTKIKHPNQKFSHIQSDLHLILTKEQPLSRNHKKKEKK